MHASVTSDARGIVTDLVIWTRSGSAPWRRASGPSVSVDAHGGRIEGYVEALGPGGAVVAQAGSRSAPIAHRIEIAESPQIPPPRSDDTLLHIGIAAGAGGLALVVVIIIAVVASQPSSQTRLDGPVLVGF